MLLPGSAIIAARTPVCNTNRRARLCLSR